MKKKDVTDVLSLFNLLHLQCARHVLSQFLMDMSTSEISPDAESGTRPVYKVYKRRFWGLAQLVLLNIVVSWDVCTLPAIIMHERMALLTCIVVDLFVYFDDGCGVLRCLGKRHQLDEHCLPFCLLRR
jgi:hypothetical protein